MNRITLEEARDRILSRVSGIEERKLLSLSAAYGRICAEDIYSSIDVPAFPRSAMDGYAVNSCDIADASQDRPVKLTVIGELYAGDYDAVYSPGTAVRVMTGAYVPEGYDCVVKQEDTDCGDSTVNIYSPVGTGMNRCPVGEEFSRGELLVKKGTKIGRIEEFLLASAGIERVNVIASMRVGFIFTGSELDEPFKPLRKGHIYNGLMYLLASAARDMGIEPVYCLTCADDEDDIADTIQGIIGDVDMLVTTGGVSVGKKDLIPAVINGMGADMLFHGTDIQPGTPTMASVLDGKVVLSLSGNPFAALANFDYYMPYIAAKMTGSESPLTCEKTAVLADGYGKVNRLRRFVRARYEDGKVYLPTDRHFSSVVGNLTQCNCYIDIPADTRLSVGDTVKIRMMKN